MELTYMEFYTMLEKFQAEHRADMIKSNTQLELIKRKMNIVRRTNIDPDNEEHVQWYNDKMNKFQGKKR